MYLTGLYIKEITLCWDLTVGGFSQLILLEMVRFLEGWFGLVGLVRWILVQSIKVENRLEDKKKHKKVQTFEVS